MNQQIQTIADKVTDNIAAKAIASPDPAKINATDHAEILNNILEVLDDVLGDLPPPDPSKVAWNIPPLAPTITANSVSETQSEVNNNGDIVVIPAQTITIPYAASGKKRKDAIVASYTADPPFYARVAGAEVDVLAIAPTPSLNPNDLFVRWVDVTDGVVSQSAAGAVKSVSVNGGAKQLPNANGELSLTVSAGSSDAATVTYSPADNNNTTGFFAGLVASGSLMVKAALDAIITKLKSRNFMVEFPRESPFARVGFEAKVEIKALPAGMNITSCTMTLETPSGTGTARSSLANINADIAAHWAATPVPYRIKLTPTYVTGKESEGGFATFKTLEV